MAFSTVPLPKKEQLSRGIQETLSTLPALNIFRMISNVPQSFDPFLHLGKSLLENGKFSPRLREIAALRLSHKLPSAYAWHQHVFLARSNGVTDSEIEIIARENPVISLGKEENFICKVAEEISLVGKLSDATFYELFTRYSIELGMELILFVSYLNMLARFANASRLQIEETNPLEGRATPFIP
jgi:4-carboxymuconolactone decarboxylase